MEANAGRSYIPTADGTHIFYKDWGTGEPLVFSSRTASFRRRLGCAINVFSRTADTELLLMIAEAMADPPKMRAATTWIHTRLTSPNSGVATTLYIFLREPLTITRKAFPLIEAMRVDSNIAAGHLGLDAADTMKPAVSSLDHHLTYTAAAMVFIDDKTSNASNRPKPMKQRKLHANGRSEQLAKRLNHKQYSQLILLKCHCHERVSLSVVQSTS